MPRLSLEQKLAALALALGVVALFGEPRGGEIVRLDTRELAAIVETDVDQLDVHELADWIIRGGSDYRLVDLRSEDEFATYHIPSAESATVAELPERDLKRNERIVLYAADPLRAGQAWFLLRARGYAGATVLAGGLNAWRELVLFPQLGEPATQEERRAAERAREVAAHFGGEARGSAATAAKPSIVMPVVEAPIVEAPIVEAPIVEAPTHAPKQMRKRRRKKEGC